MRAAGFTVLELMVVLAILGIMTGVTAGALLVKPRPHSTAGFLDSLRTAAVRTGSMSVAADSAGNLHVALPDGRIFPTVPRAPHD